MISCSLVATFNTTINTDIFNSSGIITANISTLSGSFLKNHYQNFKINQTAPPGEPILVLNSEMLNDTSVMYTSGSKFDIYFNVSHTNESIMKTFNVEVMYNLPKFVAFFQLLSPSCYNLTVKYRNGTGLSFFVRNFYTFNRFNNSFNHFVLLNSKVKSFRFELNN